MGHAAGKTLVAVREADEGFTVIARTFRIPVDPALLALAETAEEAEAVRAWARDRAHGGPGEGPCGAARRNLRERIAARINAATRYADVKDLFYWILDDRAVFERCLPKALALARKPKDAAELWRRVNDCLRSDDDSEAREAVRAHLRAVALKATKNARTRKAALAICRAYRFYPFSCDLSDGLIAWCRSVKTLADVNAFADARLSGKAAKELERRKKKIGKEAVAGARTFSRLMKLGVELELKLPKLMQLASTLEEARELHDRTRPDSPERKRVRELLQGFLERGLKEAGALKRNIPALKDAA